MVAAPPAAAVDAGIGRSGRLAAQRIMERRRAAFRMLFLRRSCRADAPGTTAGAGLDPYAYAYADPNGCADAHGCCNGNPHAYPNRPAGANALTHNYTYPDAGAHGHTYT